MHASNLKELLVKQNERVNRAKLELEKEKGALEMAIALVGQKEELRNLKNTALKKVRRKLKDLKKQNHQVMKMRKERRRTMR